MTSCFRPAVVAVLLVTLCACSGGRSGSVPTDRSSSTSAAPTTGVDTRATTTTATRASTSARAPIVPGVRDETLRTADGRDRTYRVYIPTSAASGASVPLVLGLHGGTGWGAQFEESSGLDRLADERGFIAVYPDGVGSTLAPDRTRTWNAGLCCGTAVAQKIDDVAFLRELLDRLEQQLPIDPTRVHAIGHSNGAMLAYRLTCELADRIVSVGLQAGNLGLAACRPAAAVSLLHLHGGADANVPIGGGKGIGLAGVVYPPVIDGLRTVAAVNGCGAEPRRSVDAANADIVTTTWSGCRDGTEVRYVEVAGATHAWMGRPTRVTELVGTPYEELDATSLLAEFVLARPRR